MTPDTHYRLALQIAAHGISAHHHDVVRHVADLRRHGLRNAAMDIAVDPSQPEVARERAFGLLPVQAPSTVGGTGVAGGSAAGKVAQPCSAAAA